MANPKWRVLRGADGKIVSSGFTNFTPTIGQSIEEYDDVDPDCVAECAVAAGSRATASSSVMDPLKAKIENETITLVELVRYFKAKGDLP